jgi:cytochrome c oxidase assembly factor 2
MPPHLHPRSTATSTLFAGTLLASFTVVAIPHIFPCPRPRRAYADVERPVQLDSEGRPVRRKRRKSDVEAPQDKPPAVTGRASEACSAESKPKDLRITDEAALFRNFQEEAEMLEKEAHECPVPKPSGVLGRLLGFQQDGKKTDAVRAGSRDSEAVR